MEQCMIHYFTGTGNTYHLVNTMDQELKESGYEVTIVNIEKGGNHNVNCEGCQRCINMCPHKSIQLSVVKLIIFIIFEIAPIFIIKFIPTLSSLPMYIHILLYILMFILGTIIANGIISILTRFKCLRKIFIINYTKYYRRNIAIGYRINN